MKLQKQPYIIGLLQSIGIIIYTTLIALFFNFLEERFGTPPKILGMVTVLSVLVVSVAISGLIVFGYPAYLAINKKIKEALSVLGYTFLFSLAIILMLLIFS